MKRVIRRVLLVSLLVGSGTFVLRRGRLGSGTPPAASPGRLSNGGWPAFTDVAEPSVDEQPQRWLPPVDGQCPIGHPIKANDNSKIFHVPGGRFYERTLGERCYAESEHAVADGYRAAKA